jgi:hypothetical protein
MSDFRIRPAARGKVKAIAAFAGPSGSGKTYSSLRFARGLAGDGGIVVIDTEHGRSQMYADVGAPWSWLDFQPPFGPTRYVEALEAAEAENPEVVVVDSISHEYEGQGGLFDLVDAFLQKRAGDDQRKRSALSFAAWNAAKSEHKKLLLHLLRMPCHVVLNMRAQDKIELVKEGGQLKAIPKRSLTGLEGWEPICERRLPYEMTCSFLMLPDRPGVPRPLKAMPPDMAPLVPLDEQITEQTGERLRAWAAGPTAAEPANPDLEAEADALADRLLDLASDKDRALRAINAKRGELAPGLFLDWLGAEIAKRTVAA